MVKLDKSISDTFLFSFLILLIASITRMGASIYLPAIPTIGKSFGVSASAMSNTLTVYFIVFAISILFAGMISDAYGRRKVLLSGMAIFIVGSTICALSKSYEALLVGRAVQAFGASMIPGTLVALVKDICSQAKVISLLGLLAVLGGLFLVVAPVIGGFLIHFFNWNATFWFLIFFSVIVFFVSLFKIPETHLLENRQALDVAKTFKLIFEMLINPKFIIILLPTIAFFAIQGVFLSAAPYILMLKFKLSAVEFGLSNSILVVGLFSGQWLGLKIYKLKNSNAVYRVGMFLSVIEAIFLLLIAFWFNQSLSAFMMSLSLFAAILGMMNPIGFNLSLAVYNKNRGVASSLQGALVLGASALGGALFSATLHNTSLTALATFGVLCALFCLIAAISVVIKEILL
jgi:DHA1 family bicyclomycin/chloramphenicol resistance-like MFS transporter